MKVHEKEKSSQPGEGEMMENMMFQLGFQD
jgi:hypothetical protein